MTTSETHELMAPLLPTYELNLLETEDREQMESHVRQCDECFEMLFRFAPISSSLLRIKKSETVKPPKIVKRPRWHWLMTAIMAMLLVMSLWLFRQSSKLQREIMRGAAQIQLLAPLDQSEVQPPVLFRWEDEPEAEFYKIYIFQNEIIFVAGERVNIPQYAWMPPTSAKSGKYHWKVESFFSDGTRIRDSITFVLKIKR